MVIAIDPGDILKKYAHKMEFLGKIYHGSEHEIGQGYRICKAVATDIESKRVIPLYCEAYSMLADEVKSQTFQFLKVINLLFTSLKDLGACGLLFRLRLSGSKREIEDVGRTNFHCLKEGFWSSELL